MTDMIFDMSDMKFFISFKEFYKVHNVQVWSQDPHQQKEF
jgi:hypothetical protein